MRKLLIFILMQIPVLIWGQHFGGGILGGISASQVDGDTYAGFDKAGLQGGVFVNTFFSEKVGIQMEIKYTGRGARKKTSEEDPDIYKLSLHYIDIPVMLDYIVQRKIIIEAGLVPGYLFGSSGEDNDGKIPQDYLVDYKKFDLDWLLGLRYKITDNISAGIRYSYSLFSIRDYVNSSANYSIIANLLGYSTGDYNNYLTMGIYYQFR